MPMVGHEPIRRRHAAYACPLLSYRVLFILFDIEVVILFTSGRLRFATGHFGLVEMVIFIVVLLIGYVYAWKKGALEWE